MRLYGCPPGPVRAVRIKLPAPLGHRQVILNHQETFWSAGRTRLILCSTAGTACQHPPPWPPSASCTNASYGQAMDATYPPEHSDYDALGCDGRWLVLNVGWPGGAAGCDGPSCGAGSTVTHWFFRASKHGWIVVATSLTAGCTRVHQAAPQFPAHLCAALPAVGPTARTRAKLLDFETAMTGARLPECFAQLPVPPEPTLDSLALTWFGTA